MTKKYDIIDKTPEKMNCIAGVGCPKIYEVIDKTLESMKCIIGFCPAVYEVKSSCLVGACPSIYEDEKGKYFIIGRLLTPEEIEEAGLAKKVSENEAIVEIPKDLLENILREHKKE